MAKINYCLNCNSGTRANFYFVSKEEGLILEPFCCDACRNLFLNNHPNDWKDIALKKMADDRATMSTTYAVVFIMITAIGIFFGSDSFHNVYSIKALIAYAVFGVIGYFLGRLVYKIRKSIKINSVL